MPLSIDSPRFSIRTVDFEQVGRALDEVGHVVLDDAWSPGYLADLLQLCERQYGSMDEKYRPPYDLSNHEILSYIGGVIGFSMLDGATDDRFFLELDRSGLPSVLRHLFAGDFVVNRNEHAVRRLEPTFLSGMAFVGLHDDYQVGVCARAGLTSKRAITIWTPFQPCVDDEMSRLVLLHFGETLDGLFEEHEEASKGYFTRNVEARKPSKVELDYQRIFDSRRCYAPYVPLGSSIIFDYRTVHGTFGLPGTSRPRYSMDFRVVGEYAEQPDNGNMRGVIYRKAGYPIRSVGRKSWRTRIFRAVRSALKR